MSVLKVKNGDQWDIVPAIKGDTGDPAADESITDTMLVPDGIKTEIDWLWGNQLMDIREGELLQTDDAYEAPLVSLDVDGESTQVVTTGKNLFDKNTAYAGWYINSSGIRANGSTNSCTDFIPVVGGNAYAFSYGAALAAGNYIAWYTDADQSTVTGHRVDARNLQKIVATAPSDANYVRFSFQTSSLGKIQLEAGSSATAYEPYTGGKPSPSPDYPQEIVSVDDPTLAFAGNNILDPSFLTQCGWTESNGTYTGTPKQLYQGLASHKLPVACAPNTQYVFAWYQISSTNTTNSNALAFRFVYSDGTQSADRYTDLVHTFTATSAENKTVTALLFSYISNPTLVVKRVQLVPLVAWNGSIEENYQPYIAPTTVPLLPDGYSLRSLPNGTKDELHLSYLRPSTREGWAWYNRELVQRVTSRVFNGTESWVANGAWNGFHIARPSDSPSEGLQTNAFLNTRGVAAAHSKAGLASALGATSFGSDSINYNWDNETGTGHSGHLAEFKAWLVENNMTIQYLLATPVTTQLDPIELPIMPSKDTTIWSDPSAQLKLTYIQDTNLVIESLEATVADMATS